MRVVILIVVLASVLSVDAKRSRGTQRDVCAGLSDGQFVADAGSCSKFFVCYNETAVSQSCERNSFFNETELHCLPDTNNICPQVECDVDGEFSGHESNCFSFYVCYDGKLVEQNCDVGSYFDQENSYCIPDTNNTCIQPECSEDGNITAHPTNCNLFYVCFDGKLYEQSCGPGSYFDVVNHYCLPDNDNICPQPQCNGNGTFSPHPTDCALFYVCYDGLLIEQTCGNGSYFNKTDLSCLPDTNNICWTDIPTPEPCTCVGGYTNGEFVASPDSCYSYYVCSDGELVEQNCGYGNYFVNTTRRCERDTNGTCWPLSNSCPGGYEEGEKIGNNDSCYSYFLCSEGQLVAQSCGVGNYFDNCSNTCLCDTDGICWPTTPTPVPVPCECPGGYNEGDLIGNSDSCSSYFICSQGELVAHSCGTGNYFDNNDKACVPDTDGICWPTTTTSAPVPCQCAGGYNEGDLIANSDSCSSYFICSQGELVAHSCGTGNYFDNNSKACVSDSSGICWPTTTTSTPVPCQCAGGYNEGDLIANSDSCSSYFICSQGELVAHSCETGNYFDNNSKACVSDSSGICWPTTTTSAPVPCQCAGGYNEGDLIGNSDSCSSYFICSQGELVAHSCGTGNYFDNNSKACVSDSSGICWPTTTTSTPVPCQCAGGYNEGDLIANSDSCSSYFICSQGELVAHSCGTGNYFDNNNKACVSDSSGICWPTTTTSAPVPCQCAGGYNEGDLIANSDNCSSYFICSQGELVAHSCGTGNYFDNNNKVCVLDSNETCCSTTPTPAPPVPCVAGYNEGDLIANSDNCSSYFICTQGELVEDNCRNGYYFDNSSKTCLRDENGFCWKTPKVAECPGGYKESDLVPNSDNCSSYYVCISGDLVAYSCAVGNYFDKTSKNCVLDINNVCWKSTCSGGYEDGELIAYPESCYKYYVCYQGELIEQSCKEGSYFEATSNNCVKDSTGRCWSANTTVTPTSCAGGYENGELIPYLDSCYKYYVCYQGELIEQSCKEGSYFEATSNNCVKDSTGRCWSANKIVTPGSCTGGYEDGELIPYPDSCYKYYVCYQGELIEQSCKEGSYFEATSNNCVKDATGRCWSANKIVTPGSCTGGYEDGELIPYPDSCYKYYVCYQGELIEQSCKEERYFDATSNNCVKDSTGICWSANTNTTTTASTPTPNPTTQTSTPLTSKSTSSTSQTPPKCPGGYDNGELIPDPNSCYKYNICFNGELTQGACLYGNYFDPASQNCVSDRNYECWPSTSSLSTSTASTPKATTPTPTIPEKTTLTPKPTTPTPTPSKPTQTLKPTTQTPKNTTPKPKTPTTPISTSSTSQIPPKCPGGYDNGEFIPDRNSCYKYKICFNSELIQGACEYGNYFDPASQNCVSDINNECWPSISPPSISTSSTPKDATPKPTTSTPSKPTPKPTSPTPTPTTLTPTSPTTSTTREAPRICPDGYDNGDFVPYPNNCYKFYICYRGQLLEQSCKEGNYFDADSATCVRDTTGKCWPIARSLVKPISVASKATAPAASTPTPKPTTLTPSSPTTATTPGAPCTCPGGYKDGDFVPYPNSCYKFYICYKGQLFEQSCKKGNYFDDTTSSCARDTTGICWTLSTSPSTATPTTPKLSCPGGYEDGQFISNLNSCYMFYVCHHSELVDVSCGYGNYYDNKTHSCVLDSDGVCWSKSTSSSTTKSTFEGSCPGGYANGEFVPHPDTCHLFSICSDGKLTELSCGPANYFDNVTRACTPDKTGFCWPKQSQCSNGLQDGQLTTNPSACYLYLVCIGEKLVEGNCGTGNYFNNGTKSCERDTENSCWQATPTPSPEPAPCECSNGLQEGQLTTNPSACYLYLVCIGGKLVEGNCGTGNYFNNGTKSCERDTENRCWQAPPTPSPEPTPCECSNGMQEGQLTTNPSACYLYLVCIGGKLVEGNCGTGNYFNNGTKSCERDTENRCWQAPPTPSPEPVPCECSNGLQEGQLTTNPSACYLYLVCIGGKLVEGNCGTGNYFNNGTKNCELDTENRCWQAPPTPSPEPAPCECSNGLQEGQLTTNPSACYLYLVCIGGKLVEGNCGTGNYFNNGTKSCERDTENRCWQAPPTPSPEPTPCECSNGMQEGQLTTNPSACYLYLVCIGGKLVEGNCGTGNYFNNGTKSCERDTENRCWQAPPTPSPEPTPCECSNGLQEGQLTTNPSACYLYLVCIGGKLVEGNCGTGNYFNNGTKNCELDTENRCWQAPPTPSPEPAPCECSNGLQEGQLTTNPSACYLYLVCIGGKLVEGNCGTGNYFNNGTKNCELDTENRCWQAPPTPSPEPAPCECSNGLQEGQLTTNPSACYLYLVCIGGKLVEGNCGTGNYFNNGTKSCERDTENRCWQAPPTPSPEPTPCECSNGLQEGQLTTNPSACYLYLVCIGGKLVEGNCGTGNYFNNGTKSCERDTENRCWQAPPTPSPEPTPCECSNGLQEGQLTTNPSACYLYLVCIGGKLVEGNCGTGNYFNNGTKSCERDTENRCWQAPPTPSPEPTPCECSNGLQEGQLTTNPSACYLYLVCIGGKLVEGNCGTGNYFNNGTKNCELDTENRCWQAPPTPSPEPAPCECSNGLQEGQLTTNPSACYLYLVCIGGKLVEGNCGTGNYFNNGTKSCERDTENRCWQAPPTPSPEPTPCECSNGLQEGQLTTNPSACYLYLVCIGGKLVEGNCGTGNYFNNGTKSCERDTENRCWQAPPTPSPEPTPCECSNGLQEGQLTTNPSACYLYLVCIGGKLVEGNCGTGNYFNNGTKNCERDTEKRCWQAPPTPSPEPTPCECSNGLQEGQLTTNPSACYLYLVCIGGKLVEGNCGTGNYFNNGTKSCERDTENSCWQATPTPPPEPAPCECSNGLQEGQLTTNPSACYLYLVCIGGKLVEGNCGTGNYFNNGTKNCELDTENRCWQAPPTPSPEPAPCVCSNGLQEGQLTTNPSACYLYLVCIGGKLVEGNCGTGNYFNNGTKSCERDTENRCWQAPPTPSPEPTPCECSNGLQEGQLTTNPSACYLYLVCIGGKLVEGNCGTGNYFNNGTKSCERDTENRCWQAPPTPSPEPAPCECSNGLQEGQLTTNPSACYLYLVCIGGKLVEGNCGTGNYFNNGTKSCERDTENSCWQATPTPSPEPAPCECSNGLQEGQLTTNPSACYLYLVCIGGKLVEGNCGTGNYFNNGTKNCELDTENRCWQAPPTPSPEPAPCECSNGLQEGQLTTNPSACYLYLVCIGGKLVEGNCGTGNYFNNGTKNCERDTENRCWQAPPTPSPEPTPCECSNGLQEGQLTTNPSACYLYLVCIGGKLVEGNCGTGNYFNNGTKSCERDTENSCWQATSTPPPEPAPCECSNGLQEGQLTTNPSACYLYLVCIGGKLVEGNCGTGNYFNNGTKNCELDTENRCWQAPPTPSPEPTPCECSNGLQEGQLTTNPSACYLYLVCIGGKLVEGNCGTGNYFNNGTKSCERDTENRCWQAPPTPSPEPTPCECSNGLQEGQLTTNPSACYLYLVCIGGKLVEGNCGTGNYFNNGTKNCELDTENRCWQAPPTPSPEPAPCECSNGLQEGQLTTNPSACYLYLVCIGGKLVEGNCGTGNYFNNGTKSCERDTENRCWQAPPTPSPEPTPCECSNGLQEGQLTTNPSACYLYLVCIGGKLVEGNCGTGNYFNNVTKSCERDTENRCWQAPPTPSPGPTPCECSNGLQEGQLTTNPSACYLYLVCIGGKLVEGNCGTGNYFNNGTKSCERDTENRCWQAPPTPSPEPAPCECSNGLQEGQLTTNPSACYLYLVCIGGKLVEGNCGTGNYFNNGTKSCERDTENRCWQAPPTPSPEPTPCECSNGLQEGQLATNPSACYLYLVCIGGKLVEGNCGTGNYFNNGTKSCERDTENRCWQAPPTPSPEPTPCECSNGLQEGQLTTNPSACYLYLVCIGGKLVEGNCGTGNYFNNGTKSCERDTENRCWQAPPTPSPEPTPCECSNGLQEGQLTTNPSACYLYLVCIGGKLVEGNCGTGNYFNNGTKSCERDTENRCWQAPPTPSPEPAPCECSNGLQEGQLTTNPSACYLYLVCIGGKLVEGNCGTGNYFNNGTKSCERDTENRCWQAPPTPSPEPTPCECSNGLQEGQLATNPSACYLYLVCIGGKLVEGNCGTGNYFNNGTKSCERDTENRCWQAPPTPSPEPAPCECSNGLQEGQLTTNPSACYLYLVCIGGKLVEGNCGTGNYFNNGTKSCERDTENRCWQAPPTPSPEPAPCECSNGMQEGQLTTNPSACYLYLVCIGGKLVEGNCGTGNYFNNGTKSCERDTENRCWQAPPTPSPEPAPCECSNGLQEGQLTTNPSACYLYLVCIGGKLVEGNCGTGNYFNNGIKSCERDTENSCWQATPTPSPEPAPCECSNGLQEGQLTTNPSACYLYLVCTGGKLVEGNCGTGNYFNNGTKSCERDTENSCWQATPTPSPEPAPCECSNGLQEGQLTTNPSACYLYFVCTGGKLVEGNCGTGNYFNNGTKSCERDTENSCWQATPTPSPEPAPCECSNGLQEGQLTTNPSACYLYFVCTGGKLVEGNCGTGNYFNNGTKSCEHDTENSCWQATPTPSPEPAPCECSNGLQEGQLTSSQSACYMYLLCTGGKIVEGNCGTGNYFNNGSKTCEPDTTNCCWPSKPQPSPEPTPCECSNGLQEGQFTAHPSSCYLYYICTGGELVEGNCGTGNYFNNYSNICEPDMKGCCWPKETHCPGGYANGAFVPNEQCDKFSICYEGSLVEQECGVGYFFDIDNNYCTRDINRTCWTVEAANNTCEGVVDGTFLPNEAACDKFFVCYNNTKIPQDCGIGNLFNGATLTCTRDTLRTCWKKIPNICANKTTGTLVANPSNCQEFYICHNNRAVLQQCGDSNWFNPTRSVCQPDYNGTCINVCLGTKGDIQLPHPNCNQFYECSNGRTIGVGTCPYNINFDATLRICRTAAVCETSLCSNSLNGVVYPVYNDETRFYSCYNFMPLKLNCPDGTSFDTDRLICTPDTGRCIGKKNGYTVGSHKNPNSYYVCRDNMAIFAQCPSYAIFDEKKGVCVHAHRKRVANNICSAEPDGVMIPGDACNKYHLCLDNEVIEQNCGAYSSFNQKLGYCVFNLTCIDKSGMCAQSSDLEKFPDARFENSFWRCKRGIATREKCPKNLIYSTDVGYCVPREMAMTDDELEELCNDVLDNTMAPALDCRKFFICRNNIAVLQQCAIDQYFDVKTASCQPDVERKCWMRSETLRRSFFLKTVCFEGQIRALPGDCSQFERCTYGVWTSESCPKNHFFDSKINTCTQGNPRNMCPQKRSVECFEEMPLRPSETSCSDYYFCKDNNWKLFKCPMGQFFSRELAKCTNDASSCAQNKSAVKNPDCIANETISSNVSCSFFNVCNEGDWWYRYCEEGTYFNKSQEACVPNDGTCFIFEPSPCKNGTAKKSDFDPCTTYHLCVDGSWIIQHCPSGHHFNETHKACMLDDEDKECQNEINPPCVEGDRRFQRSNCKAFDMCSFGKWITVNCSNGFFYDITAKMCIANSGECSTNGLLRRNCIDNTSHPNRRNCSEFFYCSRNGWHLDSCQESFHYNETIGKCVSTNNTCLEDDLSYWPRDKCFNLKSGTYIRHETDCTKYYLCVDYLAVEGECNYGYFFDNESKHCELNNGVCPTKKLPEDKICENESNGTQIQNPANCTTFYICIEIMLQLSYCPTGQYFNYETSVCENDTGICNKQRTCDDNSDGNLPHETYCNVYYVCQRGVAIPVACDEDYIFDQVLGICIFDIEHRCVGGLLIIDKECEKVENNQTLADLEDCTKYIKCSNGQAQKFECPVEQFFNVELMTCSANNGSCIAGNVTNIPDISSTASSVTPDPEYCVGKHGQLMSDPEHCNGLYVCIYGNVRHDRCFDGEFFNATINSCQQLKTNETCTSVIELSKLCETCEDGTNFADQTDCRKYYQCNEGELQSKKCRTGESFDTLLNFCRQNDGTCLLENGQRVGACAGKHGKLTSDTENCRGYFTCVNGQKIPEECDNEEFFDKVTASCQKDVNSTCRSLEDKFSNTTQLNCNGLTELVFYPNFNDDCKTFFQCVKGLPRVHKCPDDLLFNSQTGKCDWKDYVTCTDLTKDQVCNNASNGAHFVLPQDNCDSYYICTDGKAKIFKCNQGLKFNVKLKKCDLAANFNCTMTVQS